jgi:hypothetical protein
MVAKCSDAVCDVRHAEWAHVLRRRNENVRDRIGATCTTRMN